MTLVNVNIFVIFTYLMKYDTFPLKVGLYVAKYLDFSYLFCFGIVVLFNAFFYSEENTGLIMKAFFMTSLLASLCF